MGRTAEPRGRPSGRRRADRPRSDSTGASRISCPGIRRHGGGWAAAGPGAGTAGAGNGSSVGAAGAGEESAAGAVSLPPSPAGLDCAEAGTRNLAVAVASGSRGSSPSEAGASEATMSAPETVEPRPTPSPRSVPAPPPAPSPPPRCRRPDRCPRRSRRSVRASAGRSRSIRGPARPGFCSSGSRGGALLVACGVRARVSSPDLRQGSPHRPRRCARPPAARRSRPGSSGGPPSSADRPSGPHGPRSGSHLRWR